MWKCWSSCYDTSIITAAATKLRQRNEALTTQLFVDLMVQSLGSRMEVVGFEIDNDNNIIGEDSWDELNSFTFVELSYEQFRKELNVVLHSFEKIFDATKNKSGTFIIWQQITLFLSQLQGKAREDILFVFAVGMSVKLLLKFVKVKDFEKNVQIVQCMTFCLQSVSEGADAIYAKELLARNKDFEYAIIVLLNEFLEHLAEEDGEIFLKDPFEDAIANILEKEITASATVTSTLKSVVVIETMMKSNKRVVKTKIFQLCSKSSVQEAFVQLMNEKNLSEDIKVKIVSIQSKLLRFSRQRNMHFQRSSRWYYVFGQNLFSPKNKVNKALHKLFLLDVSQSDNRLKSAINAFRVKCNDSHIREFMQMFHIHADDLNELFELLNENLADSRLAELIFLIVNGVADDLSQDSTKHDQLVILTRDIFRYIEVVHTQPKLVYRLMNVINIEQFKNDAQFKDKFVVAETYVLRAFYESDNYGTAVGLLEILNRIGFDDDKLHQMLELLFEKQSANVNSKTTLYLWMAADDTFEFFRKIHDGDKFVTYNWLKQCLQEANNPEIKSCYVALIVNMLAADTLTPNIPNMDTNFIQTVALHFSKYLDAEIMNGTNSPFTHMIVCTSFYVLNTAFTTLPLKTETLEKSFHKLDESSYGYYQNFSTIDPEGFEYDLRLVTKFWSSLNTMYDIRKDLLGCGDSLLEYLFYADVHLKRYVEGFVLRLINYGPDPNRFFAMSVREYVLHNMPITTVKRDIKTLFELIKSSEYACYINAVALQVFLRLLHVIGIGKRTATVTSVQFYLYANYLTQLDRENVLADLNERIIHSDTSEKERYQEFLNKLQASNECQNIAPEIMDPDISQPPVLPSFGPQNRNSSGSFRQSMSLASINLSLIN